MKTRTYIISLVALAACVSPEGVVERSDFDLLSRFHDHQFGVYVTDSQEVQEAIRAEVLRRGLLSEQEAEIAAKGVVVPGVTTYNGMIAALGVPDLVNTTDRQGVHEIQAIYGALGTRRTYVYLRNGVVFAVQHW